MTSKLLQFMVFVKPPTKLNQILYKAHLTLKRTYSDKYKTYFQHKWNSHLMLYRAYIYVQDINKAEKEVLALSKKVRPVACEIENIIQEKDYFKLEFSEKTNIPCFKLRDDLKIALKPFQVNYLKKKYRDKWDTLSEIEQRTLIETGTIHPFTPHISIGNPGETAPMSFIEKAINWNEVQGTSFSASELWIEVSDLRFFHKKMLGPFKLKG